MGYPCVYMLSGFGVGLLVGLTGVGGAALMTPLLVLLFGVHPATAVGTDLTFAGVTKLIGTGMHSLNDAIDWMVVRRLAFGSVPGAALTLAALAHQGIEATTTAHIITRLLGAALIFSAIAMLGRRWLLAITAPLVEKWSATRVALGTTLLGLALGVVVSATSVGAGAIGATALALLYPRMSTLRIVGSDIAHAVPLTLVAGAGHWFLGSVNVALLAALLAGSVPGILLGSHFAARLPEVVLQVLLGATIAIVGGKLLLV